MDMTSRGAPSSVVFARRKGSPRRPTPSSWTGRQSGTKSSSASFIAGAVGAWVPDSWWQAIFFRITRRSRSSGAVRGAARGDPQLRMLDLRRPARGRVVERLHQLRRCARVHLRGPDRVTDPGHLPPVLRVAYGGIPADRVIRRHGHRRVDRRISLPGLRSCSGRADGQGRYGQSGLDHTTMVNIVFLCVAAVLVTQYFRRSGGIGCCG